jgi:hypothetical protein
VNVSFKNFDFPRGVKWARHCFAADPDLEPDPDLDRRQNLMLVRSRFGIGIKTMVFHNKV